MRYNLIGKSGLRVSELCLGAMTFGDDWGWGSGKDESREIYDAFVEAGGNFIDTADLYTNGTSERFLGEFMVADRERIALATKYTNSAEGTDPNAAGNHRKNMMLSVASNWDSPMISLPTRWWRILCTAACGTGSIATGNRSRLSSVVSESGR